MNNAVMAGAAHAPAAGQSDAPTARVVLPVGATDEQWHALRRSGIGGSDVAAILGLDRYRGPWHVYEAKHDRGEVRDTAPMQWGRRLEAVIAEAFTEESGLPTTTTPGTLAHLDRPWMLANVDRYVVSADGPVAPLECKNRSEHQASDWDGEVPDGPALQAHWYMAVGGWSHAWVAALIGGNRLAWHRLDRDEELITHLVDFCGAWWQRHVVEGYPPPPDGSMATTELLDHLWDARPGQVATVDTAQAISLRRRRALLKAWAKKLQTKINAVENEMKTLTGDAEIANTPGGKVWTWKQNGTFRSSDFRDEQPDLAAQYTRLMPALDVQALAADHPDIYGQYRARRLHVPEKGPRP